MITALNGLKSATYKNEGSGVVVTVRPHEGFKLPRKLRRVLTSRRWEKKLIKVLRAVGLPFVSFRRG